MAQLQFDCRNKSDRVPHERAARSTAEMAEAAPVDGGFYLRLDALEAKLEAQVPKTLNLESQMLKLQNDFGRFLFGYGFFGYWRRVWGGNSGGIWQNAVITVGEILFKSLTLTFYGPLLWFQISWQSKRLMMMPYCYRYDMQHMICMRLFYVHYLWC